MSNDKTLVARFDIHQNHVKSVLEILDSKEFCYSAEIIPPRNGTDFLEVFSHVSKLKDAGFDFISVTHGAGGSLRGGTLPIAYHSQAAYAMTSIAHLTCRGMTVEDLENVLIDHHYFGIHNILALRGDPPDGLETDFKPVEGGYSYAYQLVETIKNLNEGRYLKRKGFDDSKGDYREGMKTRFCIGVACYPEDQDGTAMKYLEIKKNAGAEFAISQIIFNYDIFARFHETVQKKWGATFPVIPGIRIPTSHKQLKRMREKFGIDVPADLYSRMEAAEGNPDLMRKTGEEWAEDFVSKIKTLGIKGIHFFIMGNSDTAIHVKSR